MIAEDRPEARRLLTRDLGLWNEVEGEPRCMFRKRKWEFSLAPVTRLHPAAFDPFTYSALTPVSEKLNMMGLDSASDLSIERALSSGTSSRIPQATPIALVHFAGELGRS